VAFSRDRANKIRIIVPLFYELITSVLPQSRRITEVRRSALLIVSSHREKRLTDRTGKAVNFAIVCELFVSMQ